MAHFIQRAHMYCVNGHVIANVVGPDAVPVICSTCRQPVALRKLQKRVDPSKIRTWNELFGYELLVDYCIPGKSSRFTFGPAVLESMLESPIGKTRYITLCGKQGKRRRMHIKWLRMISSPKRELTELLQGYLKQ